MAPSNPEPTIVNKSVGAVANKAKESQRRSQDSQPRLKKTSSATPAAPVGSNSNTMRGQKRKSDVSPPADDDALVTESKKVKTVQNADSSNLRPLPTRAPRQNLPVTAQPAGENPTSSSSSGAAMGKERAMTRKRPAEPEGEGVDEDTFKTPVRPPLKRVKNGGNENANKPQPLRRSGLYFHFRMGKS